MERIKKVVERIVSDRKRIDWIMADLTAIVRKYNNYKKAEEILSDCFEKYVKFEFSEENFKRFLYHIDPDRVSRDEAQEEFSEWDDSEDCSVEMVGACARNENLCDLDCFEHFLPLYRKRRRVENRRNPYRMNNLWLYAMLQENATTDQDRLQQEAEYEHEVAKRARYAQPLGWNPNWKLKKKHP